MSEVSLELLALQDADALLEEKSKELYVNGGTLYSYLPHDTTAQAAFGALVGARVYIAKLTREHVTGEKREITDSLNENANVSGPDFS